MHALADDSGLCIDALWGQPGIRSARWSEDGAPRASAGAGRATAPTTRSSSWCMHGVWPEHRGRRVPGGGGARRPRRDHPGHRPRGAAGARSARRREGRGGSATTRSSCPRARPGRPWPSSPPAEKDGLSHRGEALRRLLPDLRRICSQPLTKPRRDARHGALGPGLDGSGPYGCRGVAQPGSAPALGAGGRRSESGRPDSLKAESDGRGRTTSRSTEDGADLRP